MINRNLFNFAAYILLSVFIITVVGCFDFSGKLSKKVESLKAEKEALERKVVQFKPLFAHRDALRQELENIESDIEKLKEIIIKEKGNL